MRGRLDYLTRVRPGYAMSCERSKPGSTRVRPALRRPCENGITKT